MRYKVCLLYFAFTLIGFMGWNKIKSINPNQIIFLFCHRFHNFFEEVSYIYIKFYDSEYVSKIFLGNDEVYFIS